MVRLALLCLLSLSIGLPRTLADDSTYDETEAKKFASLSSATYCEDTDQIMDWTCSACKDSQTPLVPGKIKIIDAGPKDSMRIVVGKLKEQSGCLMAIRGSHNVENWISDFKAWQVEPVTFKECDGCQVHSGFYAIWQNVEDRVLGALSDVGCSNGNNDEDNLLYVTGHSLGAAMTHLSMFTLANAGFKIAKSYSFEAPRVGNRAFSDAFTERFTRMFPLFRITHAQDPIVHLPPECTTRGCVAGTRR